MTASSVFQSILLSNPGPWGTAGEDRVLGRVNLEAGGGRTKKKKKKKTG